MLVTLRIDYEQMQNQGRPAADRPNGILQVDN